MIFTQNFTVLPHQVDMAKRLTPYALLDLMIDVSDLDAVRLLCGIVEMQQNGFTWVLSRISCRMQRYPSQGEVLCIKTWVRACNQLYSTRLYRIETAQGEVLGEGVSYWSVIDVIKRNAVDMQHIALLQRYLSEMEPGLDNALDTPARVISPQTEAQWQHTVAYSDTDFNGHANSAHYLRWMMDIYPLQHYSQYRLAAWHINYQRETYAPTQVQISCQQAEEGDRIGCRNLQGQLLCKACFEWKQI